MILVGDTNLEAETSTETLTKYLDLCQAGCEEGRPLFSSPSKHLLRRQTARIAVAPLLGEATVWPTNATGPPSITETALRSTRSLFYSAHEQVSTSCCKATCRCRSSPMQQQNGKQHAAKTRGCAGGAE